LQVKECDARHLAVQVSNFISRVPHRIEEFKHWKGAHIILLMKPSLFVLMENFGDSPLFTGAELQNWLVLYPLPVLRGILPIQYLRHLALLVGTIYIFSSQSISRQEYQLSICLLDQFYQEFSVLYGVYMPSNLVHLIYLQRERL
jgi:hypothetical protein